LDSESGYQEREVQVAPQETEISSYIIGGTKQDVDKDSFKGFSL
jgi:hypothetical protein